MSHYAIYIGMSELCHRCYLRWWKATPPEERAPIPPRVRSALAGRIKANVTPGEPDDCHEWTGVRDDKGYGLISVKGRSRRAHRVTLLTWFAHTLYGDPAATMNIQHA